MVDKTVLASKIAAVRDAVRRIAEVLPTKPQQFQSDRAAAGLRNLIAHQYGVLDVDRIFEMASSQGDDLLAFCEELARRAGDEDEGR